MVGEGCFYYKCCKNGENMTIQPCRLYLTVKFSLFIYLFSFFIHYITIIIFLILLLILILNCIKHRDHNNNYNKR